MSQSLCDRPLELQEENGGDLCEADLSSFGLHNDDANDFRLEDDLQSLHSKTELSRPRSCWRTFDACLGLPC